MVIPFRSEVAQEALEAVLVLPRDVRNVIVDNCIDKPTLLPNGLDTTEVEYFGVKRVDGTYVLPRRRGMLCVPSRPGENWLGERGSGRS